MNKDTFIKELDKLDIKLTDEQLAKLDIYKSFLIEYNEHTNLTTIIKEEDIYLKHFYDSITIVKSINLNNVNRIVDVGTGAGFPGMVLKIVFPHLNITLIDSNNKKTRFLNELAQKLNIEVNIINDRVENFAKNNLNSFDVVTSRAVANLRVLSEISLPLVKVNGYFIALKGKVEEELREAKETIEIMGGIVTKTISFNLYNDSGIRNIVVVKKIKENTKENLRNYDKIVKKPLKKVSK